jgi:hypothetical protein
MVPNQPPIATNTLQNNGVLKLEHFFSVDINTLSINARILYNLAVAIPNLASLIEIMFAHLKRIL